MACSAGSSASCPADPATAAVVVGGWYALGCAAADCVADGGAAASAALAKYLPPGFWCADLHDARVPALLAVGSVIAFGAGCASLWVAATRDYGEARRRKSIAAVTGLVLATQAAWFVGMMVLFHRTVTPTLPAAPTAASAAARLVAAVDALRTASPAKLSFEAHREWLGLPALLVALLAAGPAGFALGLFVVALVVLVAVCCFSAASNNGSGGGGGGGASCGECGGGGDGGSCGGGDAPCCSALRCTADVCCAPPTPWYGRPYSPWHPYGWYNPTPGPLCWYDPYWYWWSPPLYDYDAWPSTRTAAAPPPQGAALECARPPRVEERGTRRVLAVALVQVGFAVVAFAALLPLLQPRWCYDLALP
jgi:hypothetical protein